MNLLEVIEHCGGVNAAKVQCVKLSAVKVADKKRTGDCEITFATNETNASNLFNGNGKVGLIVWLDGDKAREALK